MTKTNMINPEEVDRINESLITLMNEQQDLTKTNLRHAEWNDMQTWVW